MVDAHWRMEKSLRQIKIISKRRWQLSFFLELIMEIIDSKQIFITKVSLETHTFTLIWKHLENVVSNSFYSKGWFTTNMKIFYCFLFDVIALKRLRVIIITDLSKHHQTNDIFLIWKMMIMNAFVKQFINFTWCLSWQWDGKSLLLKSDSFVISNAKNESIMLVSVFH